MSAEESLQRYLTKVRENAGPAASAGDAERRVELILIDLELPWRAEAVDMWAIDSDVGVVRAGLNDDDDILTIWQVIGPLPGKPKKLGELFHDLLRINADTRGACLAITGHGDDEALSVIARLNAPTLDKEEFAMALEDVFATSKLFDPPESA